MVKQTTRILARVFVGIMLLIMYAPILLLMVFSFTEAKVIGSWTGFSLDLYPDLFRNTEIVTAVVNTVVVALSSAAVSTVLGTVGAIGIHYSGRRMKTDRKSVV